MAFPMNTNGPTLHGPTSGQAPSVASSEVSSVGISPGGARDEPINILIVDDEPKNLIVLRSILDDPNYHLVQACSADQALLALLAEQFALLILDIRMPEMTGFELAQMIKERKKTAQVPIIFLTAYYNEDQHVLEGYGAGAVDYLHKPVNASILRSKVAIFAELHRKNREAIAASQALFEEVTERRRADERLRELNETLEHRVASRTAELQESRARLRHAAELAKLTYFDLDYGKMRLQTADNFPEIMGFSLPAVLGGEDAVAAGRMLLERRVAPVDRDRFAREIERLEGGVIGKVEYRVVGDDGKERWIESEWHTEIGPDRKPRRAFAANIDITERKLAEEHRKILMAEVNHRSKNLLTVVQAIVQQTAHGADPKTFARNLSDRIYGLSASQDLLIKGDWHGVDMPDLVLAQLDHFRDLIGTRILTEGPSVRITAAAAQAVGMALHELATNAAKHGALSSQEGRVRVFWSISSGDEPLLAIHWTEEGGPKVSAPNRKGFGHLVIGPIVESALEGKVELDFRETGISWKLSAPFPALETT
jgi:two-component sensor histidine kinase/DNA-binding response OmpR family regulator